MFLFAPLESTGASIRLESLLFLPWFGKTALGLRKRDPHKFRHGKFSAQKFRADLSPESSRRDPRLACSPSERIGFLLIEIEAREPIGEEHWLALEGPLVGD